MPHFNSFFDRLRSLKEKAVFPDELLLRINQQDLSAILNKIISDKNLAEKVKSLKTYESLRFPKEEMKLARTFSISRAPDGELLCILGTQSRDADNQKCVVEKFDGLEKKGKPSWRLDGHNGPEPYASLHIKLSKAAKPNLQSRTIQKKIEIIRDEIAFAWDVPQNDFLLRSTLGPVYTNKKGSFISVYSPLGIRFDDIDDHVTLTPEICDSIAVQLLQGLHFLDQQGCVHQDLKPGNVVLFPDKNKLFKVKMIDFGCVNGKGYKNPIHATVGYESPEIALIHTDPDMPDHEKYEAVYKEDGKTFAKICADALDEKLIPIYKKPHHLNDVWACGVMLYALYHKDEVPSFLPEEKRFQCMLLPRVSRYTAQQALTFWQQSIAKQATDEKNPKTYIPGFRAAQAAANEKPLKVQVQELTSSITNTLSTLMHEGFEMIRSSFSSPKRH